MHPYVPFAALPLAVAVAWFAAPEGSASAPGRYQIPQVPQVEDPSALMAARSERPGKPDIRVQAFLPHVPPEPPAPEPMLVLNSVMTGDGMRLASINGRIVKEGDRVEGYRVRRIGADGVELADGGRTRSLPMRPLHELPPPARPGKAAMPKGAGVRHASADLTEDFWKIFDSLKP
jgi:hypothetical protein